MHRRRIAVIVAVSILALATFWAGTAYAATNCFKDTNGHRFEQAVCWMKENGLASGKRFRPDDPTTRGQAAQWLQQVSNIPPSSGLITVSEGFGNWKPFKSTDNLVFEYYSTTTYIKKTTTGDNFFSLHPSLPTVLYGRSLQLVGVEFCYTASTSAIFSYMEINVRAYNNSGAGTGIVQFSDSTDRTDSACRYYVLPTPPTLTAEDSANIFIFGTWNTANAIFSVGRTTFVLAPTGVTAVPPSGADTTILQEGGSPDGGSTSAP
jgi:hypothetical protein